MQGKQKLSFGSLTREVSLIQGRPGTEIVRLLIFFCLASSFGASPESYRAASSPSSDQEQNKSYSHDCVRQSRVRPPACQCSRRIKWQDWALDLRTMFAAATSLFMRTDYPRTVSHASLVKRRPRPFLAIPAQDRYSPSLHPLLRCACAVLSPTGCNGCQ